MIHELRRTERSPLRTRVRLLGGDACIDGELIDISTGGIALLIAPELDASIGFRKTWLCRIDSADLPDATEFLVKVLRKRMRGYRLELACEIAAIDDRALAFIKAYRTLAKARARSLMAVH